MPRLKKSKIDVKLDESNIGESIPIPKHDMTAVLARRAKMLADYRKQSSFKYN